MVHDGALARPGGRGENQYFVHGPIVLDDDTKIRKKLLNLRMLIQAISFNTL
jgi:hypothetical protein